MELLATYTLHNHARSTTKHTRKELDHLSDPVETESLDKLCWGSRLSPLPCVCVWKPLQICSWHSYGQTWANSLCDASVQTCLLIFTLTTISSCTTNSVNASFEDHQLGFLLLSHIQTWAWSRGRLWHCINTASACWKERHGKQGQCERSMLNTPYNKGTNYWKKDTNLTRKP